jgi:hypothetical protein
MPIKYLNRSNNSSVISAGNSVLFNGSNQYLSIPNNAAFQLGTGDFTAECWTYATSMPQSFARLLSVAGTWGGSNVGLEINISTSAAPINSIEFTINGNNTTYFRISTNSAISINTWYHVAVTRLSGRIYCFLNGVLQTSSTSGASTNINGSGGVTVAAAIGGGAYWPGYVSNVRILKGTALYTASFTAPTTPLTAVASCSLLTCQSPTIIDNSGNNFTITNNNGGTVSSAVVPFTSLSAAPNGIKFINRSNSGVSTSAGNSVLFNGSSTWLTTPSTSSLAIGTGDFTYECWAYLSSTPGQYNSNAMSSFVQNSAGDHGTYIGFTSALTAFATLKLDNSTSLTLNSGATTYALNTWHHVVLSRVGTTVSLFFNGSRIATNTNSYNLIENIVAIGKQYATTESGVNGFTNVGVFNGYISNARVVIGGTQPYSPTSTTLTVPTTPISAISNTKLLTCNAATIVDGSTNNFTITNNGSATVSSTTPFTAISSPSTIKLKKVYADAVVLFGTQKAIFGYGNDNVSGFVSTTNLVSNTGVVATDTTGVGTARANLAAAGYGGDKAIFGYGFNGDGLVSMTNLVSNAGVVATDTTGVGTARYQLAAAGYGTDKAIFGYGNNGSDVSTTNLVSNTGVVATDTTGVGTARSGLAAAAYGTNKALFGYGNNGSNVSITNLVSNTGVVATDTTGVGTARKELAAAGYGSDKAIFGYGLTTGTVSMTNLVSNTGVVATDTTGVGTLRRQLTAAGYGTDKVIFGYGRNTVGTVVSMTNLVSNTGVVATDTTGVGTARYGLTAAGYSLT